MQGFPDISINNNRVKKNRIFIYRFKKRLFASLLADIIIHWFINMQIMCLNSST